MKLIEWEEVFKHLSGMSVAQKRELIKFLRALQDSEDQSPNSLNQKEKNKA